jgi:hypothetical protein
MLGASACGGGGGSTSGAEPTSTTTASTTTTSSTTMMAPKTIRIVFRNGKVVGGLVHAKVDQGDHVVLVVSSDVADEVHLHGYDKHVEVTPGTPARLAFVASIAGRFVAELESRGLQILDLQVS